MKNKCHVSEFCSKFSRSKSTLISSVSMLKRAKAFLRILFAAALARPFVSGVATDTILGATLTGIAVIAAVAAAAVAILTSKPGVRGISILSCVACFALAGVGLFEMLEDIETSLKHPETIETLQKQEKMHPLGNEHPASVHDHKMCICTC